MSGVGQRSPPRGGVDPQAANQQLLVDDDNDDDLPASAAAGLPASCITVSTVTMFPDDAQAKLRDNSQMSTASVADVALQQASL